jgi:RNA polymerase sigma-70 factor (ECF subfamily)
MRFIRNHWRNTDEAADIRQEVYARVLSAARRERPASAAGYVITTARNVLRNKARNAAVVSVELIAEIDALPLDADWLTPERHLEGREALRRAQAGLDGLPPRCREVVRLRKVEGLSTREVAERLGIGIDAVQQQTMLGMRALTDFMLGGSGRIERPVRLPRKARENGQ